MSIIKQRIMTKKRFKFQVTLLIDELTAVPFVTGVLYCKVRLKNGGTYSSSTGRENVSDHHVYWQQRFEYTCKMSADSNTGILDPCITRLSIRKEVRGGRSANKIGFVDLNLAEFAGSGQTSRHCLLEGYDEKTRSDNSILKIVIGMQLMHGDPLFKTPTVQREASLRLPHGSPEMGTPRLDSDSSGFGSLPRKSPLFKKGDSSENFEPGHTRNSSSISQLSKLSGYNSQHSRTPSNISYSGNSLEIDNDYSTGNSSILKSLQRSSSSQGKIPPPRPPPPHKNTINLSRCRMGETRVSADDVVDKLIESQDFTSNVSSSDGDNLQLYVASDGSTALGGQTLHNRVGSGVYHPVVFEANISQKTG